MAIRISSNLDFEPSNIQISKHAIVSAACIIEGELEHISDGKWNGTNQ